MCIEQLIIGLFYDRLEVEALGNLTASTFLVFRNFRHIVFRHIVFQAIKALKFN